MSTPSLRALSRHASPSLRGVRNPVSRPSFSYGRTAAYRRIGGPSRNYIGITLSRGAMPPRQHHHRWRSARIFGPRRSRRVGGGGVRHVSFKEMREQRQREAAGQAAKEEKPEPAAAPAQEQRRTQAQRRPESKAKAQVEPESESVSEADAAFAHAKAQSEREWARIRKAEEEAERRAAEEAAASEGQEGQEGEQQQQHQQQQKKKDTVEEPPHGTKTPWQVFTETLNSEFKASKEWNESTQQLSGSIHDFTQNPNVQRVGSAYKKGADAVTTGTGKVIMGTASAIGKSAAWTWDSGVMKGVRAGATVVGSGVEKATRPLRETEAYKNVKDVVDDGASQRYGGWTEKEERRKQREAREARLGIKHEILEEDPNAGTNVTLHKDSAFSQGWKNFRDNSPIMQRVFGLGATYRESENPLISTARSVSDRIAGFFAENETAMVIKKFREMDPTFQLEPFLTEMRTYILPEVLEAYVKGDTETLQQWLSAAQYSVYSALMTQYTQQGLISDGRILDIRGVDILSARLLEPGEIPVFVLMARTQEVHVYRNKKSGELAAGMEDKVQQVTYAIGVTRVPEEVQNPETRGWRLIELQKSARDYL